ncbi:MAG: hypothetical protein M1818_000833 [Claussenomyces sp. TS43310]|nr:MAG: hypothetical protein M1818_000833 [Claussenomyces sp. TS43310]
MDAAVAMGEERSGLPPRLFERLRQIAGYTWDHTRSPIHSTYDNWHVFGRKSTHLRSKTNATPSETKSTTSHPLLRSVTFRRTTSSESGSEASQDEPAEGVQLEVVARISVHALREERAYHICKNLCKSVDPHGNHTIKPVDLIRLPSQQGDAGTVLVAIFEFAGANALSQYMDFGPAWYRAGQAEGWQDGPRVDFRMPAQQISVPAFLDFAVGAAECLEILHHGQRIVHGEIRGDAFSFNEEIGQVKLINFGSGLRSFEHGLTSTGWSTLSKEAGVKTKLSFISPEQTGRMPAEPDSRTDIYSLGILLWTLLTQQPAFDGDTPMDIIQSVLGRRLPSVSSVRLDVPDAIGRIITKMTAKIIGERYHSASGLRYDLLEVQKLLGHGDSETLKGWKVATKDVSSFFILPTVMIGRSTEHDEIVKVIDKVSKRHIISQKQGIHSLSSGSSISDSRLDSMDWPGTSDDATSSAEGRSNSLSAPSGEKGPSIGNPSIATSAVSSHPNSYDSTESARSGGSTKPWERNSLSMDARGSGNSMAMENEGLRGGADGVGSLTTKKNSQKFSRKGRCEVVSVAGVAGLGKSCLVQSVQVEARKRGYFASSKFDHARKEPFGPVLKLLSSLFKQVFAESETNTAFHQALKQYVRPAWPMLHKALGLPEFLLGTPPNSFRPPPQTSSRYSKSIRTDISRTDSSPSSSRTSLYGVALGPQNSQAFLRAGSSTKSLRLMNTFLDVLRVFALHKFICFCLDDLQFADDESLELISQLIASRLRIVIILTYRPDEILPERIRAVMEPPDAEGYFKAEGFGVTRVELQPLSEDDITQYVAATLCRPVEEVIPLAVVIQAKTAGNPFYMREMLDACHRKNCIWYDYTETRWNYDIDRIFLQFTSEKYHAVLDSDFVTRRLRELPRASRSILAWASVIGTSFSFELIQRLLSGEFDYDDENPATAPDFIPYSFSHSEQEIVVGLQAIVQAYVIVATENDDKFRFAHDRYIQAASSLREYSGPKMHYILAQTLLKYYSSEERMRDVIASHICGSVDIINARVVHRQSFRKHLFNCAQGAAESGARSTAAKYYAHSLALLQEDPWTDNATDVYYDETLTLYTRAAECYHYMGEYGKGMAILTTIFDRAKTPVDKAPAWILKSRLFSQRGDSIAAFKSLTSCLLALGIRIDSQTTFERCDAEFHRLAFKLQSMDRNEVITQQMGQDSNLAAVGAVLVETLASSFWSDALLLYHMTLVMVETHLTAGGFPQSGLGYLHLAMIAITRFNLLPFANEVGLISTDLIDRWRDPYTLGRGGSLYSMFVGHIQYPLSITFGQLENALEYTIQAGDRSQIIMNFGNIALLKFFGSDHLGDLESFCTFGAEEVPDWQGDTQGGMMLVSVRQICRALQGKTMTSSAIDVLSDETHSSEQYLRWLRLKVKQPDRAIYFYEGLQICPLFLYGHYERAVQIGQFWSERMDIMWSLRNTRFTMLFHGLALAALVWVKHQNPATSSPSEVLRRQVDETLIKIKHLRKKIIDWQAVCDVNYLAWSRLLDAQISELEGHYGDTLRCYEDAADHASVNNFIFEEALINYLLAGYFIRRGGRRPAKAALRETVMLYRQFGAIGVAKFIELEHSLLLQGPTRNLRTADVAIQTDFAGDSAPVQFTTLEGDENAILQQNEDLGIETKGDRIGAWQGASARPEAGSGLPVLDMLDLTSILESSQVISSVLEVDKLLTTMAEIILQNCGGLATLAAIVVEEDDPEGWSIAASGDPENGATAHIPGLPLAVTSLVAESVVLYCTRFRETVFLPDLVHDERFSNVNDAWIARNPHGKSVIALPITHGDKPLLGVLYLEGEPNAFTDRNLTVLGLLVNQIGISYSNALTLKAIEKVSASNISMVMSQKQALAKAKEAEAKAKHAEAEALRNVQLAEEAAKAKSIFLANVSHELRTPLNGVIGNSELLRDSDLRKEQADMADSIRVSADLLLTVINDILDFSKMEADKMKLFLVAFSPKEMMSEVVRSVSYSNRDKKNRDVEISQDIDLPQTLVYGDPVRLHQVLGNLIGNSIKFTERGTITVGSRVDEESKDSLKITCWIKDTGIGIPPSQLAKLFKPFSQADAGTARKYGGSGLGLSICRSLIESMMKGRIELESSEGYGTTAWFTVTFPKANPQVLAGDSLNGAEDREQISKRIEESQKETRLPYNDFSHVPREDLRICIAEDNPINQKIAIQFVQKLGFCHVDAYDNGLAAVEGLRAKAKEGKPYHLLLCDVQMPVCDGYEATKLIRKDALEAVRGVLIIAMTASAIQGDREKCLESGMNDYLAKPVRVHILKRKLEQYLQQRPVPIPHLQAEANQVANDVLDGRPAVTSPPFNDNDPAPTTALPDGAVEGGDKTDENDDSTPPAAK